MKLELSKYTTNREEIIILFDENLPQKFRKQKHCDGKTSFSFKKEAQMVSELLNNCKKQTDKNVAIEYLSHAAHHLSGLIFQKHKSKQVMKLVDKLFEILEKFENCDPILLISPELFLDTKSNKIFIGKMALLSIIFEKYIRYGEAMRIILITITNSNFANESLKYLGWMIGWLTSYDKDFAIESMLIEEKKNSFLTKFISKIAYIEEDIEKQEKFFKNQISSQKNPTNLLPIDLTSKEWKYMFSLFEILWSDRLISNYEENTWEVLSQIFPKCYRTPLYNNIEKSREISMRFCRLRHNFNGVIQYAITSREFGLYQESIELFIEASELGHENSTSCFLDIGDIYYLQKNYNEALLWYSKYPKKEKRHKYALISILNINAILVGSNPNQPHAKYLELIKLLKQNLLSSQGSLSQKKLAEIVSVHLSIMEKKTQTFQNTSPQQQFVFYNEIVSFLLDFYHLGELESLRTALEFALKCEKLSVSPLEIYNSKQMVALIYQRMKNYQFSLQFHNQSLEMASKIEDTYIRMCAVLQAMYNISTLHNITSHHSMALKNSLQAINLVKTYLKKNLGESNCNKPNFFNLSISKVQSTIQNNNLVSQENPQESSFKFQKLFQIYFQFLHLASAIYFKQNQWEEVKKLTEEALFSIPSYKEKEVKEIGSISDYHFVFLMYGKSNLHLYQKEFEMDMTEELVDQENEIYSESISGSPPKNEASEGSLSSRSTLSDPSQISIDSVSSFSSSKFNFSCEESNLSNENFFSSSKISPLLIACSALEFSISDKFESIFSKNINQIPSNSPHDNNIGSILGEKNKDSPSNQNSISYYSETKADICSVLVECFKSQNNLPKMIHYQHLCNLIDYKLSKFEVLIQGLYNISLMHLENNDYINAKKSFHATITLASNANFDTGGILKKSRENFENIEKQLLLCNNNNQN